MITVVATVAIAIVVVMPAAAPIVVLIVAPVAPPPESPAVFAHQSSSFDSRIKRRRLASPTGTID
jgi:hypothetical protein